MGSHGIFENAEKSYMKKYREKTGKGYTDVKMAIG
jgi:hypothetical protein